MWRRLMSAALASSHNRSITAPHHKALSTESPMLRLFRPCLWWAIATSFGVLLTLSEPALADGEILFDQAKDVILPSIAARPILQRRRAGNEWKIEEWAVTGEQRDRLEKKLTSALAKLVGGTSFKVENYYRQYMPARWKDFHVILVNGFYWSPSDAFPGKGIAADQWKRDLVNAFGGGCAVWYAVYVVEQDRLLQLGNDEHAIECNAPK